MGENFFKYIKEKYEIKANKEFFKNFYAYFLTFILIGLMLYLSASLISWSFVEAWETMKSVLIIGGTLFILFCVFCIGAEFVEFDSYKKELGEKHNSKISKGFIVVLRDIGNAFDFTNNNHVGGSVVVGIIIWAKVMNVYFDKLVSRDTHITIRVLILAVSFLFILYIIEKIRQISVYVYRFGNLYSL
ncbi:MAG: hypothetical protein ACOCQ4_01780, partial [bacterium]